MEVLRPQEWVCDNDGVARQDELAPSDKRKEDKKLFSQRQRGM